MDYETKIYLDKLIEAINRPDWWTIGITSAMTAIMAWIAWNQYKLQKRQAALQAYESYKPTYELFLSIQKMADSLIYTVAYHFSEDALYRYKGWEDILEELQKIKENMHSQERQIEMQLSSLGLSIKEYIKYSFLVKSMFYLVEKIDEENNIISLDTIEYQDVKNGGTAYLIDKIRQTINRGNIDKEPLKSLKKRFQFFISCREEVVKDKTLSIIKKKCKID